MKLEVFLCSALLQKYKVLLKISKRFIQNALKYSFVEIIELDKRQNVEIKHF